MTRHPGDLSGPVPPHPLPKLGPYGGPLQRRDNPISQLRGAALGSLRRFGASTSSLRIKPDYLIIGTKRGGSTSLARWLVEHPDVAPLFPSQEGRKGTYYFDVNYHHGSKWHLSHYPTRTSMALRQHRSGRPQIIGEADPYHLHHPHAALRARTMVPDAKVIALLRHPVDRAYGHWGERTRNSVEWLPFPEAIEAESSRIDGEEQRMIDDPGYVSFAHQHYSYVDQGRYERGLRRWMTHWPARQLLILRSEDMYTDPARIYSSVLDFLGLAPFEPAAFTAWNKNPTTDLDPAIRSRLWEMLDPSVQALEVLLGRSMGWRP